MQGKATARYLETQVKTASPEQLLIMLFDGALRFAEQGKSAFAEQQLEAGVNSLLRAQAIVIEIRSSLRPEIGEEVFAKLTSLYQFIYGRLVEGSLRRDAALIDEAARVLAHLRETYVQAIARAAEEKKGAAPEAAPVTAAAPTGPQPGGFSLTG